jgi:hypothetical protein
VGAEAPAGVLGVYADDKANTLWACSSSIGPNGPPSAAAAYDLKTAQLKARYPLPTTGAFCNDIAVGAVGTVYVALRDPNSKTNPFRATTVALGSTG